MNEEKGHSFNVWLDYERKDKTYKLCEDLLSRTFESLSKSGKTEFENVKHQIMKVRNNLDLMLTSPEYLEDKLAEPSGQNKVTPVLLMLKDDSWGDSVAKILYSANYEVRGIFRLSKLGGEGHDAEEFAGFVTAVKELVREHIRRDENMHEEHIRKSIDWKAKLANSKNAGFISLFSDPSMRNLSRKFKNAVLDIKKRIPLKAGTRVPSILLLGETGCGKSLLAGAFTEALFPGERDKFARFNISAYTKDLIDVELFGAKKGAYTGCEEDRKGIFAANIDNVVFLDEIGDMDPECQTRLLIYMDSGNVTPRGTGVQESAPCILAAATNKPIDDESKSGFRSDIYHRFDHVIKIPSLRERKGDMRLLISLTLQDSEINPDRRVAFISLDAIEFIERMDFPGNFRELRFKLKQAVSNARNSGSKCLCLRHLVF